MPGTAPCSAPGLQVANIQCHDTGNVSMVVGETPGILQCCREARSRGTVHQCSYYFIMSECWPKKSLDFGKYDCLTAEWHDVRLLVVWRGETSGWNCWSKVIMAASTL